MDLGKELNRFLRELIKGAVLTFIAAKTKLTYAQAYIAWNYTARLIEEAKEFSDWSGAEKREWVVKKLRALATAAAEQGIIEKLAGRDINLIIEAILAVI